MSDQQQPADYFPLSNNSYSAGTSVFSLVCNSCGSMVSSEAIERHNRWHLDTPSIASEWVLGELEGYSRALQDLLTWISARGEEHVPNVVHQINRMLEERSRE